MAAAPDEDLVQLPEAPVLKQLTEHQRHIIGHANGNAGREPGWRDYYCTADGDKDCEHLVTLGLMRHGPRVHSHQSSRYYLLTKDGALAALSDAVIPRKRAEAIMPFTPRAVDNGLLSLESIKSNPSLRRELTGKQCLILSEQWGYFWRPKGSGYGTESEAGIYDWEDAFAATHHCGPEKRIFYKLIEQQGVAA